MEYIIWLNGEFVPRSEAKISMLDRGFRLGDVVFDTSRTFNGEIFRLRDHLTRLYRSLNYTRIDPGLNIDDLEQLTLKVVQRNESVREPGDDYMITHIITRGQASHTTPNPGSGVLKGALKPNISIWIDPIDFPRYAPLYGSGAHAVIPKTRGLSSQQLDPRVKHFSRLHFVMAELEASDVDPDAFPLLLDAEGNLGESTGANFFIVSEGVLRTPSEMNTLQGVSRTTVLELAAQLGLPTSEETLHPYDLYTASEAALVATHFCVLPLGRVDNRPIGHGAPGPVAQQLLSAWSEMVGLDISDQATQRAKVWERAGKPV